MTRRNATKADTAAEERSLSELRHLILAAQREGNRWLADELRPAGLTPSQAEVLAVLAEQGELTLAQLGRLIVCETGSPSRVVDILVKRGLVRREPGTIDRRVIHLSLTPEACDLLELVSKAEHSLDAVMLQMLDPEEQMTLATLLRRILSGTGSGEAIQRRYGPR
ncbi:MarR family winged helix-turn-helix transcriptional regulator [Jatrophihabitans sp.]|uniref:MarR family winged helix-turn-helix transcriptional regulator n=1 Tax=Jatrophihabitans sp. TaxID=1932789 RepID=UPI002F1D7D29